MRKVNNAISTHRKYSKHSWDLELVRLQSIQVSCLFITYRYEQEDNIHNPRHYLRQTNQSYDCSLNLDSALVTISDMTIRMNIITPVKKKGKGQYTLSLHMWPLAVFQ